MAAEDRPADPPLIRRILDAGYRFSFFQVVRLLQQMNPDAAPVGHQGPPGKECVRFLPHLSLAFPSADVARVKRCENENGLPRYEVVTTFLGLLGADSPLPSFYTEDLMRREDDPLVRGLLNLFHHRLVSLFYRVWEKYASAEAGDGTGTEPLSRRFLCLLGMDVDAMPPTEMSGLLCRVLLSSAGAAALQPRSAVSLERVLQNAFPDMEIRVEPCVPRWVDIPVKERNRLGRAKCRLGRDASLGERVFTRHATFRLTLGPILTQDYFQLLFPGAALQAKIGEIVKIFNTDAYAVEVVVRVTPDAMPECRLGSEASRLGWSAWLGRRPEESREVTYLM